MQTFSDIINRWPSAEEFASGIHVTGGRVRQWRRRNRLPSEFWLDVVEDAASRGYADVTLEVLASIAAKSRSAARMAGARG